LLGVNTAAVLLPVGALANLLWLRLPRAEGLHVGFRQYLRITLPIALPAFIAAVVTLSSERLATG
jgi:Na+/H+ antiporter NhaD/arsenite permease-like protein